MTSVQSLLQVDLEEAVREFPAAICDIKNLRGEKHYVVCNFPGLDVGALYGVVGRYTETTIVNDPAGNGQDRYVIKSKHTATLRAGLTEWLTSWLTLRNVLTLLVTLLSLTNLFTNSPILSSLLHTVLGGEVGLNATATPNATTKATPTAAKGGFSLFN